MKSLIISTNALGDTFLSCSATGPLVKKFPEMQIDMIAGKESQLFLPFAKLDNVYYLSEKSIGSILKLSRKIRSNRYNFCFSFFPGLVNTFFFYSAAANIKSGFVNFLKRNEWYDIEDKLKLINSDNQRTTWKPGMNFLDRVSISLSAAGVECHKISKPKFDLNIIRENYDYIVISPFSKRNDKKLGTEFLFQIIEQLKRQFEAPVKVIGTAKDFSGELMRKLSGMCEPFVDMGFEELLTCIVNSKLFIGVDSFPLHLADAYDVPMIGLFTKTNPASVLSNEKEFIVLKSDNSFNLKEIVKMTRNVISKNEILQ